MTKISFSGSYGAGKTSLVEEVKKIMSLKYKVNSLNDINQQNPFDEDMRSSFISFFYLMTTQANIENLEMQKSNDLILCDRSVLDQWVLWKTSLIGSELSEKLKIKNNLLENIYKFWINTYKLIFLIRTDGEVIGKRVVEEEYKIRDNDYIKLIDKQFAETCKNDNLEIVEIFNNGSIDESAQKIIEEISNRDLI